jgi:Mn2+/Fe2+ NRAMP family transporter
VLRHLGAGLIAGLSDNDPTSVDTLSVIGATTGYRLAWVIVALVPKLIVVQVVSARVAVVTRRSLEGAIRAHFGLAWALVAMLLVLGVNLVTLGADLAAGAAALGLLTGLPWDWFVLPVALGLGGLLALGSYEQIACVLRCLLLSFLAYLAAAVLARPDWSDVLRHTAIPSLQFSRDDSAAILALLGTTLTSYVYFWEMIEEAEAPAPLRLLPLVELDAAVGVAVTALLFWAIVVSTGATLGMHGQSVQTAQDAAQALTPIAGPWAGSLFALGLLASAALAVPVIAATSGYVVTAAFRGRGRLGEGVDAGNWPFYLGMLGSLAVGAALSLLGVEPIRLLFLASIVGGLGTPVLLVLLLLLASSPAAMGQHRIAGPLLIVGWVTTLTVSLASVLYVVQLVW